jgi:NodT family efflux transporter outer membrane factor (OMF) lipoprotein
MKQFLHAVIFLFVVTACSLAPKYERPDLTMPASYKEAGKWIPASPNYANTDRGSWWKVYDDVTLDALEVQVTRANQNLKAAYARYQEARALTAVARADLFPAITGVGYADRLKGSDNISHPLAPLQYNDLSVGADLSYEIDVWGRVRNQVSAAVSREHASAADLATVALSMHAELAIDYFNLRGDDEAKRILDSTVKVYQRAYELTRDRFQGGAAPQADVDQARAQLESAKTLATDIRLKRAQLEHAIAVLIGEPPAEFSLAERHQKIKVISIAPSIPSTLLQRRPDIASAELLVAAANANIGVARAAYFPDFNLSGGLGFESATGNILFQAPSLYWSLGPTAAWILFNGGKVTAFVELAKAQYFEQVANYRQTTLTAFQQVEDNLVAIHRLNSEMQTQAAATKAAYKALKQADYRYVGGLITYLDVVLTQNIALETELTDIDIRTRRQVVSVQLIKALGGGWDDSLIPR